MFFLQKNIYDICALHVFLKNNVYHICAFHVF